MDLIYKTMDFFQMGMISGMQWAIVAVAVVMLLLIWGIIMRSGNIAALFSSIITAVIIFPLIMCLNGLMKTRSITLYEEARTKASREREILAKEKEAKELTEKNQALQQDIKALQDANTLLKTADVSVTKFKGILELGLLETEMDTLKALYEPIGQTKKKETSLGGLISNPFKPDFTQDKVLVIKNYHTNAKFGIDFNEIKIKKVSDTKIIVAGIRPKYLGTDMSKYSEQTILSEIREEGTDKGKTLSEYKIKTDPESLTILKQKEAEYSQDFRESQSDMDGQWEFLKEPIQILGQNFIKVIFSNIYPEIEFTDDYDDSFSDIKEYFNQEIGKNDEKIQQKLHDFDKHPLEVVKEGTNL